MILALFLVQASAADAERAFAAAAAREGQWTAFRRYAAPDAVMFVPEKVSAQAYLKRLKDPPTALQWSPAESYLACDGGQAVNTGPWRAPRGKNGGYFTTVWRREPGGAWRWIYDGGDTTPTVAAAPAKPTVRRASCRGKPYPLHDQPEPGAAQEGHGGSRDLTLQWRWTMTRDGARAFDAFIWNGDDMEQVVEDRIDPPKLVSRR